MGLLRKVLPAPVAALMQTTMARFLGVMLVFNLIIGAILYGIYLQYGFSGRKNIDQYQCRGGACPSGKCSMSS